MHPIRGRIGHIAVHEQKSHCEVGPVGHFFASVYANATVRMAALVMKTSCYETEAAK